MTAKQIYSTDDSLKVTEKESDNENERVGKESYHIEKWPSDADFACGGVGKGDLFRYKSNGATSG